MHKAYHELNQWRLLSSESLAWFTKGDVFASGTRIKYITLYSLVFVFCTILCFSYFFLYQKSMVWSVDGVSQHVVALAYYGSYLRDFLYSVLSLTPQLPEWDHSIGYGADILATLNYYVIGDPLTLLSLFVPVAHTEKLYAFLIVLRLYLAGLAFSLFCSKLHLKTYSSFSAALLYSFCGWALFASLRHPFFANPLIYLPLVLAGIERVFQDAKPTMFVLSCALCFVSSFYFAYMIVLLAVLYAFFRFFTFSWESKPRAFISLIGCFLFSGICAFLLSAIVLCPVLVSLFSSARLSGVGPTQDFFVYEISYYIRMIVQLSTVSYNFAWWTVLGLTPISVLCAAVLFIDKNANLQLKFGVIACALFLSLPFFGKLFNGFSYIANRWVFAFAFIICLTLAVEGPKLVSLKCREKVTVGAIIGLYAVFSLVCYVRYDYIDSSILGGILLLVACSSVFLFLVSNHALTFGRHIVLPVLVTICLAYNAYSLYSPDVKGYIEEFKPQGAPTIFLTSSGDKFGLYANLAGRIDSVDSQASQNVHMLYGDESTRSYWSMSNSYVMNYLFNEAVESYKEVFALPSLNSRAYLLALARVQYVENKNQTAPYGFSLAAEAGEWKLYKNEHLLPLGFSYDSYILEDELLELPFSQRQQVLLESACVTSGDYLATNGIQHSSVVPTVFSPHVVIEHDSNILLDKDGVIKVLSDDAKITLKFDGRRACETYLKVEGLVSSVSSDVYVSTPESIESISLMQEHHSYYHGPVDVLVNTGYREGAINQIDITFAKKGTYSFKSAGIECLPMDSYETLIIKRTEESLTNVFKTNDYVRGDISLSAHKILCLSIPYSSGWHAKVDGVETDIFNVGGMWTGLVVDSGSHEVELSYKRPGQKLGVILSCLGLFLLVLIARKNMFLFLRHL